MTSGDGQREAATFGLPPLFWRRFAAEHWERAPMVLRAPFGRPLATPEELFGALVAAAEAYRAEGLRAEVPADRDADVRFNVDNARLLTDVEQYLPATADASLEGYVGRVSRQLGGRTFELIVHQIQGHDFALWARLRELFRGLYEQIGLPVEQAEAVVFLRNHEATSFGVHRDEASVFLVPVAGRKRILAWPPEALVERQLAFCTLDYEWLRGRAIVLEGEPGDVLYWPSSHWHVGESLAGWSASISLGIRLRMQPAAEVLRHAMSLYSRRLGGERLATYAFDSAHPQASVAEPPAAISAALQTLRDVCQAPDLERMLRLAWMSRITGFGFLKVPPPLAAAEAVPGEAVVRGARRDPVLWIPWGDEAMALSANGHCLVVSAGAEVIALLERLNDGRPRRVRDLVEECAGKRGNRERLRELIAQLAALRAVEVSAETPPKRRQPTREEKRRWPISKAKPVARRPASDSSAR